MDLPDNVLAAIKEHANDASGLVTSLAEYPTDVIDVVIYHRIHLHMKPSHALKSYGQLREEFVDWNEVRISPIREIQEQVSRGENSLELSVFIKDFLEFVHADRHQVNLEPLVEENITDIRRYLKRIRNLEPAAIDVVLLLRKTHPVVPLTEGAIEELVARGIVKEDDSRDRKMKSLFEELGGDAALTFH
ncbi:MAG: hypothetical protein AAF517_27500, partial [Planctomycetota bacterium]